jgi:N-acetylated-alpha-linked acidic dipeptidase
LPISYIDAIPILKALEGYGPKANSLGEYWKDGGLGYKGVKYYVGPSPDNVTLNLYNQQEYVTTPLWNVIGIINGTIPNEVVVLGNHRDAWIAGGAGDPNSGSAALNEVIRSFGVALSKGWKPQRTIVFASWDGEEYGLIGSTEWVEEYLPWLNDTAVAYLNVDVGARGPKFEAAAAPLLNKALIEATQLVLSPNQTIPGQTVYDLWDKKIRTMGSGSDFTAFQDYAGIPSVDMGFSMSPNSAVYQYHSNYDSFHWMDAFGDPGWHYHITITRVWAILAAKLIESPILPLNVTDYADGLERYLAAVEDKLANSSNPVYHALLAEATKAPYGPLSGLKLALGRLQNTSTTFDAIAADLADVLATNPPPWWKWWERVRLAAKVRAVNQAYKLFERKFLYKKGLDGRPWFKHVVFAPGKWTGYAGATFPGLVEAVENGDKGGLWKWGSIILALVEQARVTILPGRGV